MNRESRNWLRSAFMATLLAIAAVAVLLWLAAPEQSTLADSPTLANMALINSRGSAVKNSAPVTVDLPASQIWSPERDAIITARGALTVSGFAWELGATLPFITGDPLLSVQRLDQQSYYVGWTPVISADGYILQEAETPDFDVFTSTVVPAPGTSQAVSKGSGEAGTYYYRVQATRFGLDSSRWSNVESVVVPWTETFGTFSERPPSVALAANGLLTVEVRIDSGQWHTVPVTATSWGGWSWAYIWSPLPDEKSTPHVLQTRATDAIGSVGPVDAVTITLDNQREFLYFPYVFQRWPPLPFAPTLNDINNPDNDGDYTVSWTYDPGDASIPVATFTLQEATDADFSSPINFPNTGITSQVITGQTPGNYYYRVRGNNSYGAGTWSNSRSVTVLPGIPVLNAIDNPNESSSFTISWIAGTGAEFYQLEESATSDFASVTVIYSGGSTSYQVAGKSTGTYYYRVKSVYQTLSSAWSNVVSTVVGANYYDSFNDASSGWTTHNAKSGVGGCDNAREHLDYKYSLYYEGGRYKLNVPLDCRAAGGGDHGDTRHIYPVTFAPGIQRPAERTCVGMAGRFETWDPYWSFWGIVFAASDDKSTVYSLEVNNLGDWGIVKRTDYQFPGPNHPYLNESREYLESYTGGLRWPVKKAFDANTLKVEIGTSSVIFYINNVKIHTLSNPWYVNEIRSLKNVGIIGGDWEIAPTQIGYDYFYVDEGCDDY